MAQTPAVMSTQPLDGTLSGWLSAYLRFLVSRNESFLLKVAPLALVGVLPIDLVSNIIPGIGLLDDAGYALIAIAVAYKTLNRVRAHRRA